MEFLLVGRGLHFTASVQIMHMHNLPGKTNSYMHNSMGKSDFLEFDCLAYASRRAARAVTNVFNARMAPLELNVAQFGLLAAVAKMPGSTLSAIGEAMLLDESTMARNFTVLERRGLVESEGGRGRGGKQVALTTEGAKLFARAARIWKQTNRKLAAEMHADEVVAGRAFLRALGAASEVLRAKNETASR
jgi:DNA-binding MarR family transcriptional regulator